MLCEHRKFKINSATDQMKGLVHLHIYLYSPRGKSHPITAVSGGLALPKILRGDGGWCYPLRRWACREDLARISPAAPNRHPNLGLGHPFCLAQLCGAPRCWSCSSGPVSRLLLALQPWGEPSLAWAWLGTAPAICLRKNGSE